MEHRLLDWYDEHRRAFPWRSTTDPYLILVSEVMLQQTQSSRVVGHYERFIGRFPDIASLAEADLADVLELWQGLGYPSRAKRLREAAQQIVRDGWPTTAVDLQQLPGVGPYTAAAVASFSFVEHVAGVETNVKRVLSRWVGTPLRGSDLDDAAAEALTHPARDWNQAVMELGALVCRPRTPNCDACPVAADCADPTVYEPPPRQSAFAGSDRQVRGAVLRAVLADGSTSMADLPGRLNVERERLDQIVDRMALEGLVQVTNSSIRIPQ
jgi:A/G-specific adenine glycosylase